MAQNLKIGQFHSPAGSRRDGRRREPRRASLLTSILGVVVVCVMSFAGSAAPASAATTTVQPTVLAQWHITDGCVQTEVAVGSTKTGSGPPTTWLNLDQSQTCEDPNSSRPVVGLYMAGQQQYTGGQLEVNSGYTKARLVATLPVTCFAYDIGACDQGPYDLDSVSLNLSWTATGKPVHRTAEDGGTCSYRYATATGSFLLGGGVNLLATDGGTLNTDRSDHDSYVERCVS